MTQSRVGTSKDDSLSRTVKNLCLRSLHQRQETRSVPPASLAEAEEETEPSFAFSNRVRDKKLVATFTEAA